MRPHLPPPPSSELYNICSDFFAKTLSSSIVVAVASRLSSLTAPSALAAAPALLAALSPLLHLSGLCALTACLAHLHPHTQPSKPSNTIALRTPSLDLGRVARVPATIDGPIA